MKKSIIALALAVLGVIGAVHAAQPAKSQATANCCSGEPCCDGGACCGQK